jgi:general secretion pathway protein K
MTAARIRKAMAKPGRQRGVAVVTALLLTTLAVTIVTSLFWQQQVQVRSMENQRLQLQTRWILRGALDLSRLILNQDLIDSPNYTRLNGVWSTPLEETRLDDYVERERRDNEDYNATLSGSMADAQGRFNLGNLATGQKVNTDQLEVFQRLLTNLQLSPSLAQAVANLVANSQTTSSAAASVISGTTTTTTTTGASLTQAAPTASNGAEPMALTRVEDLLAVSGFSAQSIEKLRDYVIVLPSTTITAVNVNTAPAELMAAVVANLSLSDAAAMVNNRKNVYYRTLNDYTSTSQMGSGTKIAAVTVSVKSNYFLAFSRVRLDRAALDTQSLLYRPGTPTTTVVWIREN